MSEYVPLEEEMPYHYAEEPVGDEEEYPAPEEPPMEEEYPVPEEPPMEEYPVEEEPPMEEYPVEEEPPMEEYPVEEEPPMEEDPYPVPNDDNDYEMPPNEEEEDCVKVIEYRYIYVPGAEGPRGPKG